MKKKITKLLIITMILTAINTLLIGFLSFDRILELWANRPIVISKKYDKGQSMIKAKETGKPIIALFYTDWCGYCRKFVPVFDKVVKRKAIREKFAVAYVNAEYYQNKYLVDSYELPGYPTVYLINGDKKVMVTPAELFTPNAKEYLVERFLAFLEE